MKTNNILLIIFFAVATAFCSCSSDEIAAPKGKTITLTCNIADNISRTAFADGDYSTLASIPFKWTNGDVIVVSDGTNIAESTAQIDAVNPSMAYFEVEGLKTDDGTEYKIFYGSKKARFNVTNTEMNVWIKPSQSQSRENNSEHIHEYGGSGYTAGYGDSGYSTITLPNTYFILKHTSCYMIFCLNTTNTTDNIKIKSIQIQDQNTGTTKHLMSGSNIVINKNGTINKREDSYNSYLFGSGRQSYVNLSITNPIELTSAYKYAFITFSPYDGAEKLDIIYTYSVNGGADKTKTQTINRTAPAFVSSKTYRVKQTINE